MSSYAKRRKVSRESISFAHSETQGENLTGETFAISALAVVFVQKGC